ncbi:MAG: excinuclease ABC subunit UvrA [Paludibacteraceae bacterium]|nr:excinuclease ABC subunit UvrA [Paludibacteraceae bacterium]
MVPRQSSTIEVVGARVHNLKNISVSMPQGKLTVITGLSGSGKSSLAFDTIFAEGQRRYMETFPGYARAYLGPMQRPDVDQISGLSPVISIDQKTTNRNPRSTVGTITEVYDYLRLLFARAGKVYSYKTGKEMVQMTDEEIVQRIEQDYLGKKILLLAPLVHGRKGHYRELFDSVRKKGYMYVRVDGEVKELCQGMKVDRYQNHFIELVVDRLKVDDNQITLDEKRLFESVNKAMTVGDGLMMILANDEITPRYFSRNLMDAETGLSYQKAAPHTFSFNSPSGWCPCCKGLGKVTNSSTPPLTDSSIEEIVHDEDNWFERLVAAANDNASDSDNEDEEQEWQVCPECGGQRLNREALSYRIADKNISELANMDIDALLDFLQSSCIEHCPSSTEKAIAEPIIKEICGRLRFMVAVGLDYLNLNRSSDSLSGGESQRIRLATQIGSRLVNVLYILDEPSIGLHQRDNQRLIDSLKELRDMGNTILVVEHDEQMMRQADYVVDIGPKAGRLGGEVVFAGTPAQLLKADTLTAQYLVNGEWRMENGERRMEKGECVSQFSTFNSQLTLTGCKGNNLKNITVDFPLGKMICVTGVSGSGKSTLINQTLYPLLRQRLHHSLQAPLPYDSLEGLEYVDKVIAVDQSPIGRTPRSNPATYTNVFTDIRDLFARLPEARIRAWRSGRFSFNTPGGRCEECSGNGYKTIRMHFLPDVYVPCEVCGGSRYQKETLEVRFKGKTIADVLDMTINQAVEFFESQPAILKKIKTIQDVGLGYIKLGQPSTTLSGGESQRMKLAAELSKPSTGKTVYILDEPTTGLHFEDIRILLGVLRRLTDRGNTVIVIEHNPDVIKAADWIIDLGPEGGRGGGEVVAVGTLDDIRKNKRSLTGQFI